MTAIGSLMFCADCGTLLEINIGRKAFLVCDICGTSNKDISAKTTRTVSKPSAFPSVLRTRLRTDVQEIGEEDIQIEAESDEQCEKCGQRSLTFHTKQLRSADEGSTIFYTCKECGHKYNVNN